MTQAQGLQFVIVGFGIVALIFAFAVVAAALETREERRTRRNANRMKLVRREPVLHFEMPRLRMTSEVFCQYGLHPVKAVSYSAELQLDICNDCLAMRARESYGSKVTA